MTRLAALEALESLLLRRFNELPDARGPSDEQRIELLGTIALVQCVMLNTWEPSLDGPVPFADADDEEDWWRWPQTRS